MNGIQLRRKVARLKQEAAQRADRELARGVCESVQHWTPGTVRVSNRAAVSNFASVLSKVLGIVVAVLIVAMFLVPRAPQ